MVLVNAKVKKLFDVCSLYLAFFDKLGMFNHKKCNLTKNNA